VRSLDDRHVDAALAQGVGAAQPGDAASDYDDGRDGIPAVTSIARSMPGTAKPVVIVMRAGRGGRKLSAQISFQTAKSSARSK
jgi:hypothetical protein